uniref:G protein-coupled receptor n=1 Tax=Panagrolaimus sp. JU765 TaxID=591449 RepID=A0AC34RM05_9BILA
MVACGVSIVLNVFFLIVTHLRRVEGFQEVLIFMQNISIGYILMSACLLGVAPQAVTLGTSTIRIPYGLLESFEPSFLNIISCFGAGCYLYTVLCFCILFFYRYNVTCKTSTLSAIFSRKNIAVFLIASIVFCMIQSVLLYYSAVDPQYLREKLNKTRDLREDLTKDLNIMQTQTLTIQANANPKNNQVPHSMTPSEGQNPGNPGQPQGQQMVTNGQTSYSQTSQKIINVFGTDYQRNPMIFLSLGIFTVSIILAFIGTFSISMAVICKLHETENYEQMSNKSKNEQKMLTKILMLTAYLPILLILIPGANFLYCAIRQESLHIQEFATCLIVPWIPMSFPFLTIICVPALRVTAWQIIICRAWSKTDDSGDSDMEGNTAANSRARVDGQEDGTVTLSGMGHLKKAVGGNQMAKIAGLSDAQLRALKDIAKR